MGWANPLTPSNCWEQTQNTQKQLNRFQGHQSATLIQLIVCVLTGPRAKNGIWLCFSLLSKCRISTRFKYTRICMHFSTLRDCMKVMKLKSNILITRSSCVPIPHRVPIQSHKHAIPILKEIIFSRLKPVTIISVIVWIHFCSTQQNIYVDGISNLCRPDCEVHFSVGKINQPQRSAAKMSWQYSTGLVPLMSTPVDVPSWSKTAQGMPMFVCHMQSHAFNTTSFKSHTGFWLWQSSGRDSPIRFCWFSTVLLAQRTHTLQAYEWST